MVCPRVTPFNGRVFALSFAPLIFSFCSPSLVDAQAVLTDLDGVPIQQILESHFPKGSLTEFPLKPDGGGGNPSGIGPSDKRISCAAQKLLTLVEGNLGALIMVVAGIGTIIASAFGAFRAATSLLAVAIGAFVLRSFVEIFFNAELNVGGCDFGRGEAMDAPPFSDRKG
jgi:hypothetical protein